jgi:pimeloyl-ACP methyl ester carboxylesterase
MTATDFDSTSRFIQAGDVKLHVNDVGDGQAIVMLHGAGPGATSWSNFKQNVPALSERFRLLLVDQPGFGMSDKPLFDEDSILSTTSKAIAGLLDDLGIERAHLVGNSMGGANALKFTLDNPTRVDKLFLMGPAGAAVNIFSGALSEGLALLKRFYDEPEPRRDILEAFVRIMVFDQSLVTEELLDERWVAASDPATFEGQRRVSASLNRLPEDDQLWRSIHKVKHPILMTWGRDDRVLPLDNALFAMRRFPNARLHVFPRCGHWAQLEWQPEFDRLVLGFFSS